MFAPLQTDHVRGSNRLMVYRALADGESASRAALSQRTGLSIPTVASILQELAAIGAVRPDGLEDGTGGRPAQRVALEPDARHVLAVDLSGRTARALRIDLLGRPRSDHRGPELKPGFEPALVSWLTDLLDAPEAPPVARLAIAVPGVIDPADGHVDLAPALGWHDFGLAELLETVLGRPTLLENNVNALALAELDYGVGAGAEHVIYVSIDSGVGAAIVVHGRLLRGAHAAAGEIGSSLTPAYARGASGDDDAPLEGDLLALADRFLDDDGRVSIDGSERSEAFVRFAESLRSVLHNLACALDPELLVVAWTADPEGLLVQHLRGRWSGPTPLCIVASALGSAAAARGVASLALERVQDELCRSAGREVAVNAPAFAPIEPRTAAGRATTAGRRHG
ncbi:MAG: ROK family protein [Trueperaceae bacterium]